MKKPLLSGLCHFLRLVKVALASCRLACGHFAPTLPMSSLIFGVADRELGSESELVAPQADVSSCSRSHLIRRPSSASVAVAAAAADRPALPWVAVAMAHWAAALAVVARVVVAAGLPVAVAAVFCRPVAAKSPQSPCFFSPDRFAPPPLARLSHD